MSIKSDRINIYKIGSEADIPLGYTVGFEEKITTKNEFYEISLNNITLYQDINLKKNDLIGFQIDGMSSFLFSIYYFENQFLTKGYDERNVRIKASFDSFLQKNTLNFYLKLVNSWSFKKKVYDWSTIKKYQKKIWLDVAMDWNDISMEINNPEREILLDSKKIQITEDFYCYLGQLFFGYSGYVGKNLDALDDCLSQIKNKEEYTLEILDFSHLANTLNNYTKRKNYSDLILEVLQENKIKVKLS